MAKVVVDATGDGDIFARAGAAFTNDIEQADVHHCMNTALLWRWIPTLYFAQGLPYVVVMTLAVVMYKNLGLSNTDIALYTSWLYLPWVIKPLWGPLVDLLGSKRRWIVGLQLLLGAAFAMVALTLLVLPVLGIELAAEAVGLAQAFVVDAGGAQLGVDHACTFLAGLAAGVLIVRRFDASSRSPVMRCAASRPDSSAVGTPTPGTVEPPASTALSTKPSMLAMSLL